MSCLAISLSLRRLRSSLGSLTSSFSTSIITTTRWQQRRKFSIVADSASDLFNYTSGRWILNDVLRHQERKRVFNVNGLAKLAAESVGRNLDDVISFEKFAEGESNRVFLITMCDNFKMVARIPYPATVPKFYSVASEVATMDFLRFSAGLPIPKIYGYSPTDDNLAESEYIFMEFIDGTRLNDVWCSLREREIVSVMRQLVQLEAKMMAISFPAGGSLYYAKDLESVAGSGSGTGTKPSSIPLKDKRFCIGPDVNLRLWFGRRSQLDVNRGPYESVESVLIAAAEKELAYLQQFGRPLLPFQRVRRERYLYQEQSPSDHIYNLQRYLLIAPSLVPKDNPSLNHFRIRHPHPQASHIIVSRSSDSDVQIISLLDWQYVSILPAFLLANIPQCLKNYNDPVSQSLTQPQLPKNLEDLDEVALSHVIELHRRRLIHYHYFKSTEECNEIHQAALMTDSMGNLCRRLFRYAGDPWEGETIELKVALIDAMQSWDRLTGGHGAPLPCPIAFNAQDVRETMDLDVKVRVADMYLGLSQNLIGCGFEGWVSNEHYETAMARSKKLKETSLMESGLTEEERVVIDAHWFFDDMDEEKYM